MCKEKNIHVILHLFFLTVSFVLKYVYRGSLNCIQTLFELNVQENFFLENLHVLCVCLQKKCYAFNHNLMVLTFHVISELVYTIYFVVYCIHINNCYSLKGQVYKGVGRVLQIGLSTGIN